VTQKIKIGIADISDLHQKAKDISEELRKEDRIIEISTFKTENDLPYSLLSSAIKNNEIDIALVNLYEVPVFKDKDIIIAGLSERVDPGESLVVRSKYVDKNADFRLGASTRISVADTRQLKQLAMVRPDLYFTENYKDLRDLPFILNSSLADAAIVQNQETDMILKYISGFEIIKLNPKEFIPQPGSGATAYLTHSENIEIRRIIKSIHCKDTANVTNNERRLKQLAGENTLGAYCYKDAGGYFHMLAFKSDEHAQTVRYSQSTSAGLAEKLFQSI